MSDKELDKKAGYVFESAIESVDDYIDRFEREDKPLTDELKSTLAGMLAGMAYARAVRGGGWFFGIRLLFGMVFVAIKHGKSIWPDETL